MNKTNFISALYLKTNLVSEEMVCVGLIGVASKKLFFDFAEGKIKALNKPLFHNEELLKDISRCLKNMKKDVIKVSSNNADKLFDINEFYSWNYFNYLEKYSKGLIGFSSPKPVASLNEEEFKKLFELYVGEKKEGKEKNHNPTREKIKELLGNPKVNERADTNYYIPPSLLRPVYLETKVDLLAKNGSFYAGNFIDFQSSAPTIKGHLNEFNSVVFGLRELAKNENLRKEGTFELFFNVPESKEGKDILDRVRKDAKDYFDLKEWEKLENIGYWLEKGNYRKFSSFYESEE